MEATAPVSRLPESMSPGNIAGDHYLVLAKCENKDVPLSLCRNGAHVLDWRHLNVLELYGALHLAETALRLEDVGECFAIDAIHFKDGIPIGRKEVRSLEG